MAIAAPITIVVGVVMALRQDVDLSIVLVIFMPVAVVVLGSIVFRMVPTFRRMQDHIDAINRVLREQITGIRVVRAFAREPQETKRFRLANDDVTDAGVERRPPHVGDVPHGEPADQPLERGGAVDRRRPRRGGRSSRSVRSSPTSATSSRSSCRW